MTLDIRSVGVDVAVVGVTLRTVEQYALGVRERAFEDAFGPARPVGGIFTDRDRVGMALEVEDDDIVLAIARYADELQRFVGGRDRVVDVGIAASGVGACAAVLHLVAADVRDALDLAAVDEYLCVRHIGDSLDSRVRKELVEYGVVFGAVAVNGMLVYTGARMGMGAGGVYRFIGKTGSLADNVAHFLRFFVVYAEVVYTVYNGSPLTVGKAMQ